MDRRLLLRFLRPLRTIEGTGLRPSIYAGGIQSSSKDVVTYTRQVLYTASTDKHDGVLLKVVTLARDVGIDLFRVGKADTRDFTHRGVRFLRSRRVNTKTHATLLRASIQRTRLALDFELLASFTDKLLNCWHKSLLINKL